MASSKDECLSKLLEIGDFSPYGLPVCLGGSWTGGCEPWRCSSRHGSTRSSRRRNGESPSSAASTATGSGSATTAACNNEDDGSSSDDDEELTFEIETDLTCLLRNSLWLHSQTLSSGGCAAAGSAKSVWYPR